jgi:hypothetical protein
MIESTPLKLWSLRNVYRSGKTERERIGYERHTNPCNNAHISHTYKQANTHTHTHTYVNRHAKTIHIERQSVYRGYTCMKRKTERHVKRVVGLVE